MTPNPTPAYAYADGGGRVVYCGDALSVLRTLPSESVHMCCTSPPYYGLRDYGTAQWEGGDAECDHKKPPGGGHGAKSLIGKGDRDIEIMSSQQYFNVCRKCGAHRIDQQLGLEATPAEYVANMVAVFEEVRRVLRKDGTCWVNMGDGYCSTDKWGGGGVNTGKHTIQWREKSDCEHVPAVDDDVTFGSYGKVFVCEKCGMDGLVPSWNVRDRKIPVSGLKPKDLIGMPWLLAFALRGAGWYLRSDIPWVKRNAMPDSAEDRPGRAVEYVFLLSKRSRYYFDMEAVRRKPSGITGGACFGGPVKDEKAAQKVGSAERRHHRAATKEDRERYAAAGRQWRNCDLWFESVDGAHGLTTTENGEMVGLDVNPEAYPLAHFATFPRKLVEPLILAGCPEQCCAACGAPWVRQVDVQQVPDSGGGSVSARQFAADPRDSGKVRGWGMERTRRQCTTTGFAPTCTCDAGTVPGTVLDCFAGSGTTLQVARDLGRAAIGIELNRDYLVFIEKRLEQRTLF